MQNIDLSGTHKILKWNQLALNFMGVWPLNVRDRLYIFFVIYLLLHCIFTIIDMIEFTDDFDYFAIGLVEIMFFAMTLIKLTIYRMNQKRLMRFLRSMERDFSAKEFKSSEEKVAFLNYNTFTYKFVSRTLCGSILTAILYYFITLSTNLRQQVAENSSFEYRLPYRGRPFILPYNMISYVCLCIYQLVVVPILGFGYVGTDCFLITLVLHVSGLFSALAFHAKNVMESRPCKFKELVLRHLRLIKLANSLEKIFHIVIFQQLMGTMFLLCLLSYVALTSFAIGQHSRLITWCLIGCVVITTLYVYCYTGQCLIEESDKFGNMLYQSNWYNIPPKDLGSILISMTKVTKTTHLTSGKFSVLSLSSFTNIMKTSAAWLSVLRSMQNAI